jgi:hypothetical protein
MSSVEWVRFMQDPSDFQIYFKDSIEEIVTDYTADSPFECGRCYSRVQQSSPHVWWCVAAEIVAKLKYILSRRKQ